jgi:alanyl-tRNA synthetase
VQKLLAHQKELGKEIERVKAQAMNRQFGPTAKDLREINGIKFLSQQVSADSPRDLRVMLDNLKDQTRLSEILEKKLFNIL